MCVGGLVFMKIVKKVTWRGVAYGKMVTRRFIRKLAEEHCCDACL